MTVPDLFRYLCSSILLVFLISISVIVVFRNDKTSQLVGFFALKSIVIYGLAFTAVVSRLRMPSHHLWVVAYSALELFLLLLIALRFRDLYNKSSRLPWLFAGLDFIRWWILLFFLALSVYSDSLNQSHDLLISSGTIIYSALLAIFGLVLGVVRRKKTQVV